MDESALHSVTTSESDWVECFNPTEDLNFCDEDLHLIEDSLMDKYDRTEQSKDRPKWKVDNDGKDVKIAFSQAPQKVWETAKAEIQGHRERVQKLTGKEFKSIDPIEDIASLFMGSARPLMQLLESELSLKFQEASQFLAACCKQKACRLSVEELYDDDDINCAGLMTKEKYKMVWKLMGRSGDASSSTARKKKPFWEKFQDGFNETCQEINVSQSASLIVSLDDDKKKAAVNNGDDMLGLKQVVHADKRKGIGEGNAAGSEDTDDDDIVDWAELEKHLDSDMEEEERISVIESRRWEAKEALKKAKEILGDAVDSTERNEVLRAKPMSELKAGEHKDLLKAFIKQMGWKVCKTHKANLKNAVTWLECTPASRPYIVLNKEQLKAKYRECINSTIPSSVTKNDDFIAILSGEVSAPVARDGDSEPKTPLEAMVKTTFLPPLKGEAAELCRLGHEMEEQCGKDFLGVASGEGVRLENGSVFVANNLFRAGLLQKQNRPYQKDSPDFLCTGTIDDKRIVAVVEMKARCKSTTAAKERQRISEVGEFSFVSCDSPELRKFILKRSEAVQCAHHASTLGVNHVILATGDRVGLTAMVVIEYSDEFLENYEKCINDMYESALKWAYEEGVDIPTEELKAAVKTARVKVDYESFMKSVYFWKELTKPQYLPLPPCERIIPMQDAYWNNTKHGSDVKTQYCQNLSAPIPVTSAGAKAYDRMQMTALSDIHKGATMFITKEDLNQCNSLHDFRDDAKHKMSFRKALLRLSKFFKKLSQQNLQSGIGSPSSFTGIVTPSPATPVQPPRWMRGEIQKEPTNFVAKGTGKSPKRSHLEALLKPKDSSEEVPSKRFKSCRGVPVFRANENNGSKKGSGALARCIMCDSKTHWYCSGCRQWYCCDSPRPQSAGVPYFQDSSTYRDGKNRDRPIAGVYTCFMHCHPSIVNQG